MKLSIVTTLYKSSPYIDEFYTRISVEAQKITDDYEIIFVDDGSPDDSLEKCISLYKQDDKVKVIELSRNFGHHKAIMTGLSHASGDFVFLIDIDLEEEPELLGKFWSELQGSKNVDVVAGRQLQIRTTTFFSTFLSKSFYKVFNHLSNIKIPNNELVARIMKKSFVASLLLHNEKSIFLPGIWNSIGFNISYVNTSKISNGNSSYNIFKKIILSTDAIVSFSTRPLTYLLLIGVSIFTISSLFILFIIINKLLDPSISIGWTSLVGSIWAVGGIIMLSIGVIGIYLGKVLDEVKSRPLTIIKKLYEEKN
jgi:putative glycosyltransferase